MKFNFLPWKLTFFHHFLTYPTFLSTFCVLQETNVDRAVTVLSYAYGPGYVNNRDDSGTIVNLDNKTIGTMILPRHSYLKRNIDVNVVQYL